MNQSALESNWHWVKVTPENLHEIVELDRRCFEFSWSQADFEGSLAAGHTFMALARGTQVVGYAVYMLIFDQAELLTIGVDPDARRLGIGRLLMQEMFSQLSAAGAAELFLEVRQSNVAAQGLYTSMGFEEISRRKGYYPCQEGREDALVMKKVF